MKQTGLLILLFLLCAVGGMAQKGNIVITGQVVNRQADTPRSLNINVNDSFSTDSRMNVPLDEDGRFRANLDFPFGHDFSIDYDGIFMLYASPGDSLHITIDAGRLNKDVDAITFSGWVDERCIACNRFSKEMSDVIYWRPDSLQRYDLPLNEYMQCFNQAYHSICDTVARYAKANGFSEQTRKFLCTDVLFALSNDCMGYQGCNPQESVAFFRQPVFRLNDPDNLSNYLMYSIHLGMYYFKLCEQDSVLSRLIKTKDSEAIERRQMEIILEQPKSISRDVMLSHYFEQQRRVPVPDSTAFTLPVIWQRLEEVSRELQQRDTAYVHFSCGSDSIIRHDAGGEAAAYTAICTDDFFRYLSKRHPGKVLYIDIFSTWCGPCREDRKVMPELHAQFSEKDVVFVNLCLKSKRKAWAEMLEGGELKGENYWFNEELSNRLMSAISLHGFPTYMLLGSDGRFLTRNASRPIEHEKTVRAIQRALGIK